MIALCDCNNFYVSVEQIYRPSLKGKPVCVLSNNDASVISRSEECKALGVKMGQPHFEIMHLEETAGLICLSSNFELIGEVSDRVMSLISGLGPRISQYSVDEAFVLDLDGIPNLTFRARKLRQRVLDWTGITIGIGLAPTHTLAKLMNHVAKAARRKPGSYPLEYADVCNWVEMTQDQQTDVLRRTHISDVWGVGSRYAAQLAELDIFTALDLRDAPAAQIRQRFGVVLERTVRELQEISCITIETAPENRHQIAWTRSFGAAITDLDSLLEACSEFAFKASAKLRRLEMRASAVHVFARSSLFTDAPRFSQGVTLQLEPASSDSKVIVSAACAGVRKIWKPNQRITKGGVILLGLTSNSIEQATLDLLDTPEQQRDQSALMETMDKLNRRFGDSTVQLAATQFGHRKWQTKRERMTPRYTTVLSEIPIVRA